MVRQFESKINVSLPCSSMAQSLVGSSLLKFLREGLGATTFPLNLKEIVLCSQSLLDKKFFNNADTKENVRYSEQDETV